MLPFKTHRVSKHSNAILEFMLYTEWFSTVLHSLSRCRKPLHPRYPSLSTGLPSDMVFQAPSPSQTPHSNNTIVIALQHIFFDFDVLDTFLTERPHLILTSASQPTDRAAGRFKLVSYRDSQKREEQILDELEKFVDQGRHQSSQFYYLQERTARLAVHPRKMDLTQTA